MYWHSISNHVLSDTYFTPENIKEKKSQFKKQLKNHSFELIRNGIDRGQRMRCQSVYCLEMGMRTPKQQLSQHIRYEFPMHKKDRLANIIIQNLRNNKQTSSKSINSPMLQKMREFKRQLNFDHVLTCSIHQQPDPVQRRSRMVDVLMEKSTLSLSNSPKGSPKTKTSIFSSPRNFHIHSNVHSYQRIEKLPPLSHHIKNNSMGAVHKIYADQVRLLQRQIIRFK